MISNIYVTYLVTLASTKVDAGDDCRGVAAIPVVPIEKSKVNKTIGNLKIGSPWRETSRAPNVLLKRRRRC